MFQAATFLNSKEYDKTIINSLETIGRIWQGENIEENYKVWGNSHHHAGDSFVASIIRDMLYYFVNELHPGINPDLQAPLVTLSTSVTVEAIRRGVTALYERNIDSHLFSTEEQKEKLINGNTYLLYLYYLIFAEYKSGNKISLGIYPILGNKSILADIHYVNSQQQSFLSLPKDILALSDLINSHKNDNNPYFKTVMILLFRYRIEPVDLTYSLYKSHVKIITAALELLELGYDANFTRNESGAKLVSALGTSGYQLDDFPIGEPIIKDSLLLYVCKAPYFTYIRDIFDFLLQKGADINADLGIFGTVLHQVIVNESNRSAIFLIDNAKQFNLNLNLLDGQGKTLLILAAKIKSLKIVQALLKHESVRKLINHCDVHKRTALHYAYILADKALVELLLQHGADDSIQDKFSKCPKDYLLLGEEEITIEINCVLKSVSIDPSRASNSSRNDFSSFLGVSKNSDLKMTKENIEKYQEENDSLQKKRDLKLRRESWRYLLTLLEGSKLALKDFLGEKSKKFLQIFQPSNVLALYEFLENKPEEEPKEKQLEYLDKIDNFVENIKNLFSGGDSIGVIQKKIARYNIETSLAEPYKPDLVDRTLLDFIVAQRRLLIESGYFSQEQVSDSKTNFISHKESDQVDVSDLIANCVFASIPHIEETESTSTTENRASQSFQSG